MSYAVDARANGQSFTFETFFTFVANFRKEITNRQLVSQSFVVQPEDAAGTTGVVAHTSHITGVEDGKPVTGTVVSVLKIGFLAKQNRRVVLTENFVIVTQFDKPSPSQ